MWGVFFGGGGFLLQGMSYVASAFSVCPQAGYVKIFEPQILGKKTQPPNLGLRTTVTEVSLSSPEGEAFQQVKTSV